MPPSDRPQPVENRLRWWLRGNRAVLSVIVFAVGLFLSVLAIGAFTPLANTPPFPSINSATDQPQANYNLVFVIVGPIVAMVGAYLVGAYYYARRKFEHLMVTKSKAEFLRNLPDLEETLWELTPDDEVRYERKLAEFRVRR